MEAAIAKADTLIEALGWIREFRDKMTVMKLSGSFMDDENSLRHVLIDIVFMETVGMQSTDRKTGRKFDLTTIRNDYTPEGKADQWKTALLFVITSWTFVNENSPL